MSTGISIHTFATKGNIKGAAREIAAGVPVDILSPGELLTPLMCAVKSPEAGLDMMQLLIEHGADVNAVSGERHNTVLGIAAKSRNLAKINLLLNRGADIHYLRPRRYDVLIDAMYSAGITSDLLLLPVLDLLIEQGANINTVSDYGESAMSVSSNNGWFNVVRRLLAAGADARRLQWTDLMHAIALGTLEDVEKVLAGGADLSARDSWRRTPWLLSVQTGELDKAKLLLSAGANREDRGRCGKTVTMYAVENNDVQMLTWLLDSRFDIEERDDFGATALITAVERDFVECVRLLLEAGASVDIVDSLGQRVISRALSVETARVLIAAGEDLSAINDEVRALLTGVECDGELETSREDYQAGKHRKFGASNPELMNIPFWRTMVRCGAIAYRGRAMFDTDSEKTDGPVWCFRRFGKSITELPDGRIIEIAGEHEDFYHPDFCIYNDVIVHYGGGRFDISGYPQAVFPPTDFHSATLVDNNIYIIGSLGYDRQRDYAETPVYRLNCENYGIEKVKTRGQKPGWIYGHRAILTGGSRIRISGGKVCAVRKRKEELIPNSQTYVLDLTTMNWSIEQSSE